MSGWFSSCASPADIWPSADSLPACTSSACAFFSAASASCRSATSRRSIMLVPDSSAVRAATRLSSCALARASTRRRSVAQKITAPKDSITSAATAACSRASRCAVEMSISAVARIPTCGRSCTSRSAGSGT